MADRADLKAGESYIDAMNRKPQAEADQAFQSLRSRLREVSSLVMREAIQQAKADAENDPEIVRMRAEIQDLIRKGKEDDQKLFAKWNLSAPESIDEWMHLARIVEIPDDRFERMTGQNIFDHATAYVDRLRLKKTVETEAANQHATIKSDQTGDEAFFQQLVDGSSERVLTHQEYTKVLAFLRDKKSDQETIKQREKLRQILDFNTLRLVSHNEPPQSESISVSHAEGWQQFSSVKLLLAEFRLRLLQSQSEGIIRQSELKQLIDNINSKGNTWVRCGWDRSAKALRLWVSDPHLMLPKSVIDFKSEPFITLTLATIPRVVAQIEAAIRWIDAKLKNQEEFLRLLPFLPKEKDTPKTNASAELAAFEAEREAFRLAQAKKAFALEQVVALIQQSVGLPGGTPSFTSMVTGTAQNSYLEPDNKTKHSGSVTVDVTALKNAQENRKEKPGRPREIDEQTFNAWVEYRQNYESAKACSGFDMDAWLRQQNIKMKEHNRRMDNTKPSKIKLRDAAD